jgi:hypothetical protein
VLLALSMVGFVFFLVLLVLVIFDLIWTLGNKMFGATTIVVCPLLFVWKLSLHYPVALPL